MDDKLTATEIRLRLRADELQIIIDQQRALIELLLRSLTELTTTQYIVKGKTPIHVDL